MCQFSTPMGLCCTGSVAKHVFSHSVFRQPPSARWYKTTLTEGGTARITTDPLLYAGCINFVSVLAFVVLKNLVSERSETGFY